MVQLITLFLWLVASPVWAATYYVATNGSNSNNGTSESTPFVTIQKCVDSMIAGDTCQVRGGTYSASGVRFRVSGTQSFPITLEAYPGEVPVLSCTGTSVEANSFLFMHASGHRTPIGWWVVRGFEIANCRDGVKWYNLHDTTLSGMELHDNINQGFLGVGSLRVTVERNYVHHNGPHATNPSDSLAHGMYINGSNMVIRNNILVDSTGFGIQLDGTKSFTEGGNYASSEFARSDNGIVESNTIAYNRNRSAIVIWGGNNDGLRIENNIFYENNVTNSGSSAQGISYVSAGGSSGVLIRNNHSYGSGSGATGFTSGTAPADVTVSGNVVDVSTPAFVNGGSNSLPASPDFRLTASSPVNIALPNEFPNNSTNVVGAYKTIAAPTASITANKIVGTFPINTAGPIQNLSTAGVTVGCTGSACPGSPTVVSVTKVAGTDSQFEVVLSGITGNACEAADQTWTLSYNSSTGTWTGNDNIGPAPGSHQKIFSFTNLAVVNACDGSGPPSVPAGSYIEYLFTTGSGTTAVNTGSFGAPGNGTLNNGVAWIPGGGIFMSGGNTQNLSIPYGSGVNPSTQSLTIGFLVDIQPGNESLPRTVFGVPLDASPIDERFYISMLSGTWRIGIQGSNDGTAGDLTVDVGPQHICLVADAATNTVTLHKNGVASMAAGGVKSVTSYTLPGNFELGRLPALTNGPAAVYKHFELYQSVESCAALYAATQAPPADPAGTFSQTAVQFEDVYLPSVGGGPTILPSPNNTKKVVQSGAVAVVVQIECDDCEQTAFRIEARDNGAGDWLQVPNTETAANLYMWGSGGQQFLNNGPLTTRILENGCTVVDGATLLTASQVPQVIFPASGCIMLRYLLRVGLPASGYTEIRAAKQGGVAFTGTIVPGRIDIIDLQAGGIGF